MAEETNAASSPPATADRSEPAQAVKEDKPASATMGEEKAGSAHEGTDRSTNFHSPMHSPNDVLLTTVLIRIYHQRYEGQR